MAKLARKIRKDDPRKLRRFPLVDELSTRGAFAGLGRPAQRAAICTPSQSSGTPST
jgi:hypothetical protein